MDNITLVGMPGCGKSTVGRLLARRLDYGFLDLDDLICTRQGVCLQTLLNRVGVEAFLDLEAEAVRSLRCRRHVLSPGGSAVCREESVRRLRALGSVLYLRVPLEELEGRIHNFATRGIALAPGQGLAQLLAVREPLYLACAHHVLDCTPGQTPEETVRAALELLAAT